MTTEVPVRGANAIPPFGRSPLTWTARARLIQVLKSTACRLGARRNRPPKSLHSSPCL
jgi:hypothetical protein